MLTQSESQGRKEPFWHKIVRLLRWEKPTGRLILIIPALWSIVLSAKGMPSIPLVNLIIFFALATSATTCVINDLCDRDIDAQVERTRERPLASGALSVSVGIMVAVISVGLNAMLAFALKPLSFWLWVGTLPVIILYPLSKRVFPVPQLLLAIIWGLVVLTSWTAVNEQIEFTTWLLCSSTALWAVGFDTIYAMSDRKDDQRIGVKSSALFFGKYAPVAVMVCYATAALLLGLLGFYMQLQLSFWISLIIATSAWIWQFIQLLDSELPNTAYNQMFTQNVWISSVLLFGMIFSFLKL
ncbi:4-hydroxybenzoate solanesyltransferase [Nostoc sp. XA010]|uniref:4-hydroxybenzoate solanesyltransferase n=1 Tax=Nostoc sp. XA010 TaxID=2780407 RepID=UPI001E63E3D0|nr:4-hydroxybenzoate solanesyltransferase [Nostoc sp. XA010]MCC5659851.1 4-hydroxybenzoate solanesyltransferase [Nostoc sp. XA010]